MNSFTYLFIHIFTLVAIIGCNDKAEVEAESGKTIVSEIKVEAKADNSIDVKNSSFETAKGTKEFSWAISQHAGEPSYEFTVDKDAYEGENSIKIKNIKKQTYGLISQQITLPKGLDGKKIHISSYIKTEDIGPKGFASIITFKSMYGSIMTQKYSEKIKGTSNWKESIIDVEIPKGAGSFKFGFILLDTGIGWGDKVNITYQ